MSTVFYGVPLGPFGRIAKSRKLCVTSRVKLQVNHSLFFYAVFQRYKEQAQGKRRVLSLRKRPVSAIPQPASLTLSKRAASVPPTPADMQQQVYVANQDICIRLLRTLLIL